MNAIHYDPATGRIASIIQFGSSSLALPLPMPGLEGAFVESNASLPAYFDGTSCVPIGDAPSPAHVFNWAGKQWEDTRTLNDCRTSGLALVDELAGSARLRYITSVPGQAETYQKKEQQARDWAASGFAGDPPSFIAAEAEALGRDPQAIATEVIGLADYWGNVKGPQIEASRRKSKVAIETAENSSEIDGIVAQARAELGAL